MKRKEIITLAIEVLVGVVASLIAPKASDLVGTEAALIVSVLILLTFVWWRRHIR